MSAIGLAPVAQVAETDDVRRSPRRRTPRRRPRACRGRRSSTGCADRCSYPVVDDRRAGRLRQDDAAGAVGRAGRAAVRVDVARPTSIRSLCEGPALRPRPVLVDRPAILDRWNHGGDLPRGAQDAHVGHLVPRARRSSWCSTASTRGRARRAKPSPALASRRPRRLDARARGQVPAGGPARAPARRGEPLRGRGRPTSPSRAREIALLLRGLGVELSEADLAALVERTEGWPTGVYLAALAAGGRTPAAGGDDRFVADYFDFEHLSRPQRRRPSLPHPDLRARHAVRIPLRRGARGRGLGAQAPRARARGTSSRPARPQPFELSLPPRVPRRSSARGSSWPSRSSFPSLHRRASAWCEAAGDADGAIRHAHAAGDGDRLAASSRAMRSPPGRRAGAMRSRPGSAGSRSGRAGALSGDRPARRADPRAPRADRGGGALARRGRALAGEGDSAGRESLARVVARGPRAPLVPGRARADAGGRRDGAARARPRQLLAPDRAAHGRPRAAPARRRRGR